jgi:hypothetical protein
MRDKVWRIDKVQTIFFQMVAILVVVGLWWSYVVALAFTVSTSCRSTGGPSNQQSGEVVVSLATCLRMLLCFRRAIEILRLAYFVRSPTLFASHYTISVYGPASVVVGTTAIHERSTHIFNDNRAIFHFQM